ncbi:MAG: hypothetical protein M1837_001853 [Sclerophora amabilis]|nr:MAG: hypothetical protein M1837_001853 [Sclerophora amabilis]
MGFLSCFEDLRLNEKTAKQEHDPSSAIRDSFIYKSLLPPAVKILGRWRPRLAPRVLMLTSNRILKYGLNTPLSEAHAIDFISRNTSLPVPRIITAFRSKNGECYILMTRCPGVPLCNVFGTLSPQEQSSVLSQLRGYIDELRAIVPPRPGHVGATDYGPIHDERVHELPCGPFDNVADFHKAIRGGCDYPTEHEELDRMIAVQDGRDYDVKFTHGDLAFRNVICNHGKITGIVDWESAGWYPDYWEYAMTWDSFWDNPALRHRIHEIMETFPNEREMERTRRRLFCGD